MKKLFQLIGIAGIFCSLIFAGDAEDVKQRIEDSFAHLNKMKKTLNAYSKDGALEFWSSGGCIDSRKSCRCHVLLGRVHDTQGFCGSGSLLNTGKPDICQRRRGMEDPHISLVSCKRGIWYESDWSGMNF